MLFVVGDYLAGAAVGALTALGVRALVWPGMDMVLGMLLGMGAGTVVHVVTGLALAPLLGMFETMSAAMLIGMYGGMLFGMRDSMSAGSETLAAVWTSRLSASGTRQVVPWTSSPSPTTAAWGRTSGGSSRRSGARR
jgi:hypothetical protein